MVIKIIISFWIIMNNSQQILDELKSILVLPALSLSALLELHEI